MRRAVGLVAHVYSTPLPEVWGMDAADLLAWAEDAVTLLRRVRAR